MYVFKLTLLNNCDTKNKHRKLKFNKISKSDSETRTDMNINECYEL